MKYVFIFGLGVFMALWILAQGITVYLPIILKKGNGVTPPATPTVEIFENYHSNPDYHPFLLFDAEPPAVEIDTLQEIAGGANSDQEIMDLVVEYVQNHESELAQGWKETNPARLKAFFVMYVIHISHPYGDGGYPSTFKAYLQAPASHCGPQSIYQSRLLSAFGLPWRRVAILSGLHGWVEVQIDGQWEIFDSTSNVWVDQSSFGLLAGEARQYRRFYTPWTDINRPEARQIIAGYEDVRAPFYYTPGSLRSHMPGIGIYFFGPAYRQQSGDKLVISASEIQWLNIFDQAVKPEEINDTP